MATVGLFATVMSISCSHSDRKAPADSDTAVVAYRLADEYVAENDIAMTVRSIVEAISVGEMLDTADVLLFRSLLLSTTALGRGLFAPFVIFTNHV